MGLVLRLLSARMREILRSGQDLTPWVATWIREVKDLEEFKRLVQVEWVTLESAESEGVVRVEYPCDVHNRLKELGELRD